MSDSLRLKIIATDKLFYDGEADSIIFPAPDGSRQIMAHHENMVIAGCEGICRIRFEKGGEWRNAVVGRGFVEIKDNTALLITESAEWPEDIDRVRALAAMERAKEQLRQDQSIQEYNASRAALARALLRLSQVGDGTD